MKKIGYINTTKDFEHIEDCRKTMVDMGCDSVYQDNADEEYERPFWRFVLGELKDGDTLVVCKLSSALCSSIELANLMKLTTEKNLRIISLKDSIDTKNEYFQTKPEDYVRMLSDFPRESLQIHYPPSKPSDLSRNLGRLKKKRKKQKIYCDILNMYAAGVPVAKIWELSGFKNRGTIYRILQRFGIQADRMKKKE